MTKESKEYMIKTAEKVFLILFSLYFVGALVMAMVHAYHDINKEENSNVQVNEVSIVYQQHTT